MVRLITTDGGNREKGKVIWEEFREREILKLMNENDLLFMEKTAFEQLPEVLKDYRCVVLTKLTRVKNHLGKVAWVCNSPEEIRMLAEKWKEQHEILVIGEQGLYEIFMDVADEIILTNAS